MLLIDRKSPADDDFIGVQACTGL